MNFFQSLWHRITRQELIDTLYQTINKNLQTIEELNSQEQEYKNTILEKEKLLKGYADLMAERDEEIESLKNEIHTLRIEENAYPLPEIDVDWDKHPYFPHTKFSYYDATKKETVDVYATLTPGKFSRLWTDEMYNYVINGMKKYGNKTLLEQVVRLRDLVCDRVTYHHDLNSKGLLVENWKLPIQTFYERKGDCIAEYEEIWMSDGTTKKVKDLIIGDVILSYDFNTKKFVKKKILNVCNKDKLKINRVHFRNGNTIDVTENQPMWSRINNKGDSIYNKTLLSNINLESWYGRMVPTVRELPYEEKDIAWLNEDLCFVIGHFFSEGWVDKSGKVGTCGYDVNEYIIPILEKNNIPFTEGKNGSGVPTINFLKSDFKEYLKKLKVNSFYFTIPSELKNLPKYKLQKILDGHFLGDGHYRLGRNYELKQYSTSADTLKDYLCEISLKLKKPLYSYYQINHQGAGKRPIWRLDDNPNSDFRKDKGYDNIGEVSISYVEPLEEVQTYDFEVEDTHTFIFKNGIIGHNCEDVTNLWLTFCKIYGIPSNVVFNLTGFYGNVGHSFGGFLDNKTMKIIECTTKSRVIDMKGSHYRCKGQLNGLSNWSCSGVPRVEQF